MEEFYSFTPELARNLWGIPRATARIKGIEEYENIRGVVSFYQTNRGVIVNVELTGMPYDEERCATNFYGFHIHEGSSCTGNREDPLKNVGAHYNPVNCMHPSHKGDLLPLISNNGYVWQNFLISTFKVEEIIGRTVVIHSQRDDFKTQPAGDSGKKIACGEVR